MEEINVDTFTLRSDRQSPTRQCHPIFTFTTQVNTDFAVRCFKQIMQDTFALRPRWPQRANKSVLTIVCLLLLLRPVLGHTRYQTYLVLHKSQKSRKSQIYEIGIDMICTQQHHNSDFSGKPHICKTNSSGRNLSCDKTLFCDKTHRSKKKVKAVKKEGGFQQVGPRTVEPPTVGPCTVKPRTVGPCLGPNLPGTIRSDGL